MKKILLLVTVFFLSACHQTSESNSGQLLMATKPSTVSTNSSSQQMEQQLELADEFMRMYIHQVFDLEELKTKEQRLQEFAGDTSLDEVIRAVAYMQEELKDYQETNRISTSASVTLVERRITELTVYSRGQRYFADVSYVEDSPAYSGRFDRRRQFAFKIEGQKVLQFEEVLTR
ncbi:hypothetical protein [Streptococcus suis]